jgi:hypothetical protein
MSCSRKRAFRTGAAVFLVAFSASCGSSQGTVPDAGMAVIDRQLCTEVCQVFVQVTCPNQPTMEPCVDLCLEDAAICTAQGSAFYRCIVAGGPSALICNQVQELVIVRDGFCTQENSDLFDCLSSM